ncbi:prostamide/prostaglandin F synthase-like [Watersipora subatra]|uniref:prostamide/prostaglandin F synthase-like n=1 Tax=Watersipora subatra TaxID=2589382 RepID=UPI00355B96E6
MIGVGLESLGVEQFVEGKFFDGELYIDTKKQCYKDMGYKRMSFFATIGQLFTKEARNSYSESGKLGGDLKGDGYQNGGTIVVEKGGKLLLSYVQENVAGHVELTDVLKALNITAVEGASAASTPQ